jgi:hypothetical protein
MRAREGKEERAPVSLVRKDGQTVRTWLLAMPSILDSKVVGSTASPSGGATSIDGPHACWGPDVCFEPPFFQNRAWERDDEARERRDQGSPLARA